MCASKPASVEWTEFVNLGRSHSRLSINPLLAGSKIGIPQEMIVLNSRTLIFSAFNACIDISM